MGKETAATKETAAKLQPTESESQPAARRRWNNIIPALTWLRAYQPQWLRADLIAGITLAAYLMPAGLADASLANLPPEAGLYACLFSGLVFWLFCSSRHTAVTVTSAISVLVGASLGDWLEATLHDFGRWPHARR
jgi:MFS superfamily sulfate permease-like transporter